MLDKYISLGKEISKNEELYDSNSKQASYNIGVLFIVLSTFISFVFFLLLKNQITNIYEFLVEVNNNLSVYHYISLEDKSINETFKFFNSNKMEVLSESTLAKYYELKDKIIFITGIFIGIKSSLCLAYSYVKKKMLNKYGFNLDRQNSGDIFCSSSVCFIFFYCVLFVIMISLLDISAKPLFLINSFSFISFSIAIIICLISLLKYSVKSGKLKNLVNYESNIKKLDKERIVVFNKMSHDSAFLNSIAEKASNDELNYEEIKIVDNIFETVRLREKKKKEAADRGLKYKKIINEDLSLKEFDDITITNQ